MHGKKHLQVFILESVYLNYDANKNLRSSVIFKVYLNVSFDCGNWFRAFDNVGSKISQESRLKKLLSRLLP